MKSLIWIVLFILLAVLEKDYLYKFYIFIILSIPFNKNIYDFIGLKGSTVSVLDCALIIMLILSINKLIKIKKIKIFTIDYIILMFSIIIFIYAIIGYISKQPSTMMDFIIYLRIILCYMVYRIQLVHEVNIDEYLKLILLAFCMYSLIVIYIFLLRESVVPLIYEKNIIQWWGMSRIGFSNTTNLLILPFLVIDKNLNKLIKLLAILVCTTAIIISQNRSIILTYIFIMVLQIIIKNLKHKKLAVVMIFGLTSILLILIFVVFKNDIINSILNSNNELVKRFAEMINGDIRSVDVRGITNSLNMSIASNNGYKGIGLGATLILYNVDYSIASYAPFIDNGLLTMLIKMGSISIILVLIGVYNIIFTIIKYRSDNKYTKLNLIILLALYIIVTGYINAQIIYSLSVSSLAIFSTASIIARNKYIEL